MSSPSDDETHLTPREEARSLAKDLIAYYTRNTEQHRKCVRGMIKMLDDDDEEDELEALLRALWGMPMDTRQQNTILIDLRKLNNLPTEEFTKSDGEVLPVVIHHGLGFVPFQWRDKCDAVHDPKRAREIRRDLAERMVRYHAINQMSSDNQYRAPPLNPKARRVSPGYGAARTELAKEVYPGHKWMRPSDGVYTRQLTPLEQWEDLMGRMTSSVPGVKKMKSVPLRYKRLVGYIEGILCGELGKTWWERPKEGDKKEQVEGQQTPDVVDGVAVGQPLETPGQKTVGLDEGAVTSGTRKSDGGGFVASLVAGNCEVKEGRSEGDDANRKRKRSGEKEQDEGTCKRRR